MAELPIFWTTTEPNFNDRDRHKRYMKNGKRVVEKVPQSGHVGDYNEKRRAQGTRYITMVNGVGNTFSMVLTNGAAHMDPNTAYGVYVKRKARALAWFGIGECPCLLIANNEVDPDGFMSDECRTGEPCKRGSFKGTDIDTMCPHAKAERAARMTAHAEIEAERAEKMKGKEDRILELLSAQVMSAADREAKIMELLAMQPENKPNKRKRDDE